MDRKIGFIGAGNMGKALISGIIKSGFTEKENIIASAKSEKTLRELAENYGIVTSLNNIDVVKDTDLIIIAVKPYMYLDIIKEIRQDIKDDAIVVGIAAGKDIKFLEDNIGRKLKIVKAMPNTPAMVGEAMTAIAVNSFVEEEDKVLILELFRSFGQAEIIEESLMDVVTAVSGSSPAYVYMFIEALADGAVLHGMPREMAYKFAAQAVLGASKMVLDTNIHPAKLKDDVCSPGGTTIEAVRTLEKEGFRSSILEAMRGCYNKSVEMSK